MSFEKELKDEIVDSQNEKFDLALNTLKKSSNNLKSNNNNNEKEKIKPIEEDEKIDSNLNQNYNYFLKSNKNNPTLNIINPNLNIKNDNNELKLPIQQFSKTILNNILEIHTDSIKKNSSNELTHQKNSISDISYNPENQSYSHRMKKKKNIKIGIEFDDYTTNNFYNNTANFQPLKEEEEYEKLYLKSLPNKLYGETYKKNINILEKKSHSGRKKMYNNSSSNIEKYIEKYLKTGTVTRKFDGIKVDIKDGKLMYEYEGGLNGIRQTTGNPLINQRLKMSKGDDDSVNESGITNNK